MTHTCIDIHLDIILHAVETETFFNNQDDIESLQI